MNHGWRGHQQCRCADDFKNPIHCFDNDSSLKESMPYKLLLRIHYDRDLMAESHRSLAGASWSARAAANRDNITEERGSPRFQPGFTKVLGNGERLSIFEQFWGTTGQY